MRHYFLPMLCVSSLLAGCCVAPTEPGAEQAPPPVPVAPAAKATDVVPPVPTSPPLPAPTPASGSPPAPAAAPKEKGVEPAGPAATLAPLPVGALMAGGTPHAFEDVGLTLTVPAGWTQQLMKDGSIALLSEDYPPKGKRERGAMMLVSRYHGALPTDDKKLASVLNKGVGPAATLEAGPIRLQIADKQAAQIVARATDAEGAQYRALYTIMQARGEAVAVKSMAIDNLDRRKPVFDAVMESIAFTGTRKGR